MVSIFKLKSMLTKVVWTGLVGGALTMSVQTKAQEQIAVQTKPGEISRKITCITDKMEYEQGEDVHITVTNISDEDVFMIDRKYVDAGVATIERKDHEGKWKAIELYAAATASVSKILKPGDSHTYIWRTIGYNRSDTIAEPGTYRISFSKYIHTNEFRIKQKQRN